MNRITALLLAMATLLAHGLAIHLDDTGQFAQPYEAVHRAFHLARDWVREGQLAWNVGATGAEAGGLEGYPSPLWVVVCAIAERAYLPVNRFAQVMAILAALWTIAHSAHFATDRLAGIVPPLLLMTCGAFAAAATSGGETTTVALLLTMILVGYQLHRPIALALALALLVTTRPEGVPLVGLVFALSLADRWRRRTGRARRTTVPPLWSFLPAVAVTAALLVARDGRGGSLYGGLLADLWRSAPRRSPEGLAYLQDFVATTVFPALLVFPVVMLVLHRLSGTGARALVLTAGWCGIVVARGGGASAFTLDLVPALPLIAIAVQQGLVATLDTGSRTLERLAWGLLLPASLFATLASKFPGASTTGRLAVLHREWLEDSRSSPDTIGPRARGRTALNNELERTARLRAVGRFLHDHVDPSLSLLTPWPGCIGYLSGLRVLDLFGRATPAVGDVPDAPLDPRPRVDLVAQLRRGADLVLPGLVSTQDVAFGRSGNGFDPGLFGLDVHAGAPDRARELQEALRDYELVAVPVVPEAQVSAMNPMPYYLLRRKALRLAPRLEIQLTDDEIEVRVPATPDASPHGHPQLARLEVELVDEAGTSRYLDPWGRPSEDGRVFARTDLCLWPVEGGGPQRLFRGRLPVEGGVRGVRARLYNPLLSKNHPFGPIGEGVEVTVGR